MRRRECAHDARRPRAANSEHQHNCPDLLIGLLEVRDGMAARLLNVLGGNADAFLTLL